MLKLFCYFSHATVSWQRPKISYLFSLSDDSTHTAHCVKRNSALTVTFLFPLPLSLFLTEQGVSAP